jgi:hypothetical protein
MSADDRRARGVTVGEEVQGLGGFNSYSKPGDPIVHRILARIHG